MKAISLNNQTIIGVPYSWKRKDTPNVTTYGYDKLPDADHYYDGWADVEDPVYDASTQYLGELKYYEDVNKWRYDILNYTQEEIDQTIQSQLEANALALREEQIRLTLENQVTEIAQALDDENALDSQAIFPMWTVPFAYTIGFKCQHFNADNELVLYKCVQAHTSQEDWKPKDVPALFVRVAMPDEILPWVQPTGAHDSYALGDKVTHNGQTWISIHNGANSWEPGVFGWQVFNG